jgi:hypothetical protein
MDRQLYIVVRSITLNSLIAGSLERRNVLKQSVLTVSFTPLPTPPPNGEGARMGVRSMVFGKPKVVVRIRRRDKRYKRYKRRSERYHRYLAELAFTEYYENEKP